MRRLHRPLVSTLDEVAVVHMHQQFHSWFLFTQAVVVLTLTGCAQLISPNSPTTPTPMASVTPTSSLTPASPTPGVDSDVLWEQALERATSAEGLSQSAQSRDDWRLVSNRWEQAIALLQSIPVTDPRHGEAEQKINAYKNQLTAARQRANITTPDVTLTAPVADPASPSATASPSPSTSQAIALATHLSTLGTTLYLVNDETCTDCQRQRDLLGAEAISKLNVVSCAPAASPTSPASPASPATPDPCRQANITAYPTWSINNQLYPGVQSLEQLAELSGFEGNAG
ncbi:MAG: hypothetical protein SFY66_07715 [Oculatellaceae cyanobacterium bins.114]|nr:hypothetical protein [Oculatellaceae cyanobacterium bins.114]